MLSSNLSLLAPEVMLSSTLRALAPEAMLSSTLIVLAPEAMLRSTIRALAPEAMSVKGSRLEPCRLTLSYTPLQQAVHKYRSSCFVFPGVTMKCSLFILIVQCYSRKEMILFHSITCATRSVRLLRAISISTSNLSLDFI